ncbi:cellulose synthase regulator BcsB, partial [Enterobacter cloacae]|nr:cellulose synthase regulator BcsB [Enterobacter cloacae]
MKTKLSWLCAVAMGMSTLPATMANAAPDNAAATPAPTVPVVSQATEPVVTAAPGQTENLVPNQPTAGNTLPADAQVVGQVMPGVPGANAPVVTENAPSRDVKLTFAQIAPPPGS